MWMNIQLKQAEHRIYTVYSRLTQVSRSHGCTMTTHSNMFVQVTWSSPTELNPRFALIVLARLEASAYLQTFCHEIHRKVRWKCTPALNLYVGLLSDPNRFLFHALLLTTASVAMHLISQHRFVGSSAIVHKEIPFEKVAEHAGNIRLYDVNSPLTRWGGFKYH